MKTALRVMSIGAAILIVSAQKTWATRLPIGISDEPLLLNPDASTFSETFVPEGLGPVEVAVIACPICLDDAVVDLTETDGGAISDVLVSLNGMISFYSKSGNVVLDPIPGTFIRETGDLQDLSQYLLSPSAQAQGFRLFAQSDVETVPEPAALFLVGSGLVRVVYHRRKLRQKALMDLSSEVDSRASVPRQLDFGVSLSIYNGCDVTIEVAA